MFDGFLKRRFVAMFDKVIGRRRPPIPPGEPPACPGTADEVLALMTLQEKLAFISGRDGFKIAGIPRIGLPDFWMSDATSGVRGWDAPMTVFPSAVAMAGAWNRALVEEAASRIGDEARAVGVGILLGPGVNIARIPVCGRNFEYMGEDPFLAGEIAASYVRGVQKAGVVATVKHLACNNSEYDRHRSDSIVDERTLHEIYLPAFRKAIEKGGALAVMTSYNLINGEHGSQNKYLLGEVLRRRWGFEGMVVSDWTSLYDTVAPARCGVDIEMPRGVWFAPEKLRKALDDGLVTEADIDFKVRNILRALERAGLLSSPVADITRKAGSPEAARASRAVAEEAVTLLKNEGPVLPLDRSRLRRIAVVGSLAGSPPTGGGGSSYVTPPCPPRTLAEELRARLPDAEVSSTLSRGLDAVVVEAGFGRVYESECYDRPFSLLPSDVGLVLQAAALCPAVVVVVHSGGGFGTRGWLSRAKAVLCSYYLGQYGSEALCDVLLGERSPSGKLPFTVARSLADYPSARRCPPDYASFSLRRAAVGAGDPKRRRRILRCRYAEGMRVGYRMYEAGRSEAVFPFGHGLSYASFRYGEARLRTEGGRTVVALSVANEGRIRAKETVQLYLTSRAAPFLQLKGFAKLDLAPGESKEASFSLSDEDFSFYDTRIHRWRVADGPFTIWIGSSSADIRRKLELERR